MSATPERTPSAPPPAHPGLRRSVGVLSLFATAYGNVGSSIYYALGLVAAYALGLTPVVFMFAGALFALTAKTYAEGATMFPEAGGSSSFARHAFNELVSFIAGWALMLDYLLTIAISAFFVPHYLGAFVPELREGPWDVIGAAVVVAGLAAVNIRGLSRSAAINVALAMIDIATQIVIIGLGAALVLDPAKLVDQVSLGTIPTWGDLLFAVSISMVAYTGIETIANMAQEEKDPGRDIPRAANAVVVTVLGIYLGISVVALSALPVHEAGGEFTTQLGTTFQSDPVLGIVSALDLGSIEAAAKDYVGLLAATILLIATNAGLIGISRLSWSLAEHRQLPTRFGQLYGRQRTPAFTLVFFSILAVALILPGSATFLGNLYSFGALTAFTIAHASLISLRLRRPEQERPYRAPWNVRIRGKPVSLTALIGGAGTSAALIGLVVLHPAARIVGPLWMVLGVGSYVLYRRHEGLALGEVTRRGLVHSERMPRFTRERRRIQRRATRRRAP